MGPPPRRAELSPQTRQVRQSLIQGALMHCAVAIMVHICVGTGGGGLPCLDGSEQRAHPGQQVHHVHGRLPLPHGPVRTGHGLLLCGLLGRLPGKLIVFLSLIVWCFGPWLW